MFHVLIAIRTEFPVRYRGASLVRYMLEPMIVLTCTDMLYNAAETVRDRTELELRDARATSRAWAFKALATKTPS